MLLKSKLHIFGYCLLRHLLEESVMCVIHVIVVAIDIKN